MYGLWDNADTCLVSLWGGVQATCIIRRFRHAIWANVLSFNESLVIGALTSLKYYRSMLISF